MTLQLFVSRSNADEIQSAANIVFCLTVIIFLEKFHNSILLNDVL